MGATGCLACVVRLWRGVPLWAMTLTTNLSWRIVLCSLFPVLMLHVGCLLSGFSLNKTFGALRHTCRIRFCCFPGSGFRCYFPISPFAPFGLSLGFLQRFPLSPLVILKTWQCIYLFSLELSLWNLGPGLSSILLDREERETNFIQCSFSFYVFRRNLV